MARSHGSKRAGHGTKRSAKRSGHGAKRSAKRSGHGAKRSAKHRSKRAGKRYAMRGGDVSTVVAWPLSGGMCGAALPERRPYY